MVSCSLRPQALPRADVCSKYTWDAGALPLAQRDSPCTVYGAVPLQCWSWPARQECLKHRCGGEPAWSAPLLLTMAPSHVFLIHRSMQRAQLGASQQQLSPGARVMAGSLPHPLHCCQLIRRAAGVSAVPGGLGQTSAIGRDTFLLPFLARVKVGLRELAEGLSGTGSTSRTLLSAPAPLS